MLNNFQDLELISKFLQFCNDFVSVLYPRRYMKRGSYLGASGAMHANVTPDNVPYTYDFYLAKDGVMYFQVTHVRTTTP